MIVRCDYEIRGLTKCVDKEAKKILKKKTKRNRRQKDNKTKETKSESKKENKTNQYFNRFGVIKQSRSTFFLFAVLKGRFTWYLTML